MNANLLRSKIAERGMTQGMLAKAIGVSQNTLSKKMIGRRDFTAGEILKICDALNIVSDDMKCEIFLT